MAQLEVKRNRIRWSLIEHVLFVQSKSSHFHLSLKERQSSMTYYFDAVSISNTSPVLL